MLKISFIQQGQPHLSYILRRVRILPSIDSYHHDMVRSVKLEEQGPQTGMLAPTKLDKKNLGQELRSGLSDLLELFLGSHIFAACAKRL